MMNYKHVSAGMNRIAAVLLCAVLAVIIYSCEKDEQPLKPPAGSTHGAGQSNDEVRARILAKGIPEPRAPMQLECPTDTPCGPLDVALVIDVTGSMTGALGNVNTELTAILSCIDNVSGGDYRLSLVTFIDSIFVLHNFAAGNAAAVGATIASLVASGGGGPAEPSDEAVNTAVNALAAAGRPQDIDYTPDWRGVGVEKVLILVTDAPPAGFDDVYTPGVDDVNAHTRALQALAKGIKISAIFVPTGGDYAGQAAIMLDYATTSHGVYVETDSAGVGTGQGIIDIISLCGTAEINVPLDIKPGSCPNPINVGDKGVLPVAILGSADLHVDSIDVSTLKLEGVSPTRSAIQDVAAPYPGDLENCLSCWTAGADGYPDLTLKFPVQEIVAALGAVTDGDCLTLTLTGETIGGVPITGTDIIRIVKKKGKPTTALESSKGQ
jgi:uncharacterized protein YegL